MWTESTYSAIQNNIRSDNDYIKNFVKPIEFYQKALLVLICSSSLIVLIQNRKKLSLEIILLLTVFVGGFAFHILWEAKSRYIDRKSTRLNSSHTDSSRMPSSA